MYWITEQIGTASFDEAKTINKPDVIVVSVIDLHDGWENPFNIYLRLKESLVLLAHGRKVVFVCIAGISRSNGMATTLIAFLENLEWDDAYSITKERVPRALVNMDFRDSCIEALRMMRERLTNRCPFCNAYTEFWEKCCSWCWYKHTSIRYFSLSQ